MVQLSFVIFPDKIYIDGYHDLFLRRSINKFLDVAFCELKKQGVNLDFWWDIILDKFS